jgi:hypothetical protein
LGIFLGVGTFGSSVAQDIGYGGRVEVPDSGVALTLPDDWVYLFTTPEMLEFMFGYVGEMEDDPLILDQMEFAQDEVSFTLLAYGPARAGIEVPETCTLATLAPADFPGPEALGLWVATELTTFANEEPAERPSVDYVELPVGRVARLDYDTDDWAGQTSTTCYLVPGDDSQHWLSFVGAERPEDRWLSIAETIEFLPPEE